MVLPPTRNLVSFPGWSILSHPAAGIKPAFSVVNLREALIFTFTSTRGLRTIRSTAGYDASGLLPHRRSLFFAGREE
jgi:hypothetical protein